MAVGVGFPSFLNEESPHQSWTKSLLHAAKPHWSSGGCHVMTRESKSPETETRPVCISVSDHFLHHNANHPGWLAHSDTQPDFMVPPIHMRNKHDIWHMHNKLLTLCSGNIVWWLYEADYELKRYINKCSLYCMLNNWSLRTFIIKIKTLTFFLFSFRKLNVRL